MKKKFYEWCIDNNQKIYLDNWDYEINKISPKDVSCSSNTKFSFKCPCGENHKNTERILSNIVYCYDNFNVKNNYCLGCNSFGQWCLDNNREGILQLWDYDLNEKTPFEISYNSNISSYFKCRRGLHESHKHVIYSIVNNNNKIKCPKCNSVAQYGIDNICDDFIEKYWSNKNNIDPYDVSFGSRKKIWITCQECGEDYLVNAYHFTSGVRHDKCTLLFGASKLQQKVSDYINNKYPQYTLLHESYCTISPINPITKNKFRYDNEIKELKLIIEVNGLQHYEDCTWYKNIAKKKKCTSKDILIQRQQYDSYKMNYALNNGYEYLVIPYWTENDESYKNMIDEKIQYLIKGR